MINTSVKPFVTAAYRPDTFVDVSSDDPQGRWNIVSSYPADFIFVCPTELADLQGIYVELQSLSIEVYSASRDSCSVCKTWCEAFLEISTFEFAILGDVNGVIINNFDNARPDLGLADCSTYPIDSDGIIQYIEITPEGVGRNATELLRKVKTVQYVRSHPDKACPAKWEGGEETLTPSFNLVGRI